MAYRQETVKHAFAIKPENAARAFALAREFAIRGNYPYALDGANGLVDVLGNIGYEVSEDGRGGISDLRYPYRRFDGATEDVMVAVAPCVEAGSSLLWEDENGLLTEWRFDGERFDDVCLEDEVAC